MINHPQTIDTCILTATSLYRSNGMLNLANCSDSKPLTKFRQSDCEPDDDDSTNNQYLYIKGHGKSRRAALSCASNDSFSPTDDDGGTISDALLDAAQEDLTRSVIEREICEWQYTCRTGRPYWWSAEAKRTRYKTHQSVCLDEPQATFRSEMHAHEEITEESLPQPHIPELAHMIAVQLLGSCFTLPPTLESSDAIHTQTNDDMAVLADAPMISSLRMHLYFRYSPCYGHQARNVSPMDYWSRLSAATSLMQPCGGTPRDPEGSQIQGQARKEPNTSHMRILDCVEEDISHHLLSHNSSEIESANEQNAVCLKQGNQNEQIRSIPRRVDDRFHGRRESKHSESSLTNYQSPALSVKGRERRRRAQQESEINSTTECLGTPVNAESISEARDQANLQCVESREGHFADHLLLEPALIPDVLSVTPKKGIVKNRRSNRGSSPFLQCQSQSGHSPLLSRDMSRRRRQSLLSEVRSSSDFLLATGGAPRKVEGGVATAEAARPPLGEINSLFRESDSCRNIIEESYALPAPAIDNQHNERPSLSRLETTVIRPNHDGVEVNGLPTGPNSNVWKSESEQLTYL